MRIISLEVSPSPPTPGAPVEMHVTAEVWETIRVCMRSPGVACIVVVF